MREKKIYKEANKSETKTTINVRYKNTFKIKTRISKMILKANIFEI